MGEHLLNEGKRHSPRRASRHGHWFAALTFAFLVSMSNALQARVNEAASEFVANPITAAMMSVGGGFICATLLIVFYAPARRRVGSLFRAGKQGRLSWWNYLAGMGGAIFILGQATVVPAYGVTLYMVSVVAGQSVASLLVDRLGIGVGPRRLVTVSRVAAAMLALAGALMIGLARPDGIVLAVAGLTWGLGAGGVTAIQYALNGLISQETGSVLVTSALNFFMGFSLLTAFYAIAAAIAGHPIGAPPAILEHPLLWLGGPLGLLFIAAAAALVRTLGVLAFTVTSVSGQLTGALALDQVMPTNGSVLNGLVFVGFAATVTGVLFAGMSRREVLPD